MKDRERERVGVLEGGRESRSAGRGERESECWKEVV